MLTQPPLLLSLVAKKLWQRKPSHRLPQGIRPRCDHARQSRRHLGTKRHRPTALVGEVVQLSNDLVAALPGVELEWLEWRPIVLHKCVAARDLAPDTRDVGALGELGGIKISEAGQSALSHPYKLPGLGRWLQ